MFGAAERRNPHPLFDTPYYLLHHPDIAVNPVVHYNDIGAAEGADPHPLFDTSYYLDTYPEVASAKENPFAHAHRHDAVVARDAHAFHHPAYCRERHSD